MSLKTNGSFIQNYKVTRSELRFHICCRTLTGPECSDTSVRLLQRRGRRRRRRVLDAVQRCQSSSQLLFWEKEHIPLCWLPLLLSLHRTATHCDQPAVAARSFLSHSKLLKLFLPRLSSESCTPNFKKFPISAKWLLLLFSFDQLNAFIYFVSPTPVGDIW